MKPGFKTKNYRINSLIIDSIILKYGYLFKILLITSMLTGNSLTIINTSKNIGKSNWLIINDDIMGGVSNSNLSINDNKNITFRGIISFENNGGFASCRMMYNFNKIKDQNTFILKVRGDGKKYKIILRSNDSSVYYSVNFKTKNNVETTHKIKLNEFDAFFRGRKLNYYNHVDISDMNFVGFQISDKQEGIFSLEVIELIMLKN